MVFLRFLRFLRHRVDYINLTVGPPALPVYSKLALCGPIEPISLVRSPLPIHLPCDSGWFRSRSSSGRWTSMIRMPSERRISAFRPKGAPDISRHGPGSQMAHQGPIGTPRGPCWGPVSFFSARGPSLEARDLCDGTGTFWGPRAFFLGPRAQNKTQWPQFGFGLLGVLFLARRNL